LGDKNCFDNLIRKNRLQHFYVLYLAEGNLEALGNLFNFVFRILVLVQEIENLVKGHFSGTETEKVGS
jgi:hypothetical protein